MPKLWRYTLSIICLLILLFVLWRSPETEELINTLGNNAQADLTLYPSAIIEGAQSIQFDALGNIKYQLNADQALFFEKSNANPKAYVEYQNPELFFYESDQNAPMIVQSEIGYSRDDGETIVLEKNVLLKQTFISGEQYTLRTDTLTVLPKIQFAQTDKPVIINAPSGETTATGLTADFKKQRIELLSNVRGSYVQ